MLLFLGFRFGKTALIFIYTILLFEKKGALHILTSYDRMRNDIVS